MQTPDEGYEYEMDPNTGEILEHAMVPVDHKTEQVAVNSFPQIINPNQMPDLDAMEEGFTLAAKYIEFMKEGESERGVFLGFTKMKNQKGDEIDLANFQNKNGVWVNAGANLVFQLHDRGVPHGTPLQVTYRGKVRTNGGNEVKTFDVRILNHKAGAAVPNPIAAREQAQRAERQAQGKQEWTEEIDEPTETNNAPVPGTSPLPEPVNIPSTAAKNGIKRAVIRTNRMPELVQNMITYGYVPEGTEPREQYYHIAAIAGQAGFVSITNDNLEKVWQEICKHYEDKKALSDQTN